jgi:hypothetical protein
MKNSHLLETVLSSDEDPVGMTAVRRTKPELKIFEFCLLFSFTTRQQTRFKPKTQRTQYHFLICWADKIETFNFKFLFLSLKNEYILRSSCFNLFEKKVKANDWMEMCASENVSRLNLDYRVSEWVRCDCVCERENEREGMSVSMCVCVCVCVSNYLFTLVKVVRVGD